jgi:enterochelin esterase family protein
MKFRAAKLLVLCAAAVLVPPAVRAQDLAGDLTLHRLLIEGEQWQIVAEGLGFADGPCSDADGNFFFSDMQAPGIFRIALDGSQTKIADEPASGLKFGPDGRLYACQGSEKRIIALDPGTGAIETIAQDVQPNDLVITRSGFLYFTETGKQQVTRMRLGSPPVQRGDHGIPAPNGITLSPDQGTLAISDYAGEHVWTFRVEADGTLTAKEPYMSLRRPVDANGEFRFNEPPPYKRASNGDGMTSDTIGRYYVTSALGVQVFDPIGRLCGVIPAPQAGKPLTSCAFAGPERSYLYVTNGDKIFRRKMQAVGTDFQGPAETEKAP